MEIFKIIASPSPLNISSFFYPLPLNLKIVTNSFHLIVYNDIEN